MVIFVHNSTFVEKIFSNFFIRLFVRFSGEKIRFIKRHLGIMSSFNPEDEREQAREFVLHYLKDDGVFLTRLLSINSSDLLVTELINQLWLRYKRAASGGSSQQQVENDQSRSRLSRIPLPKLFSKTSKDTDV